MEHDTPVYFCTVVHNRWENFKRLFASFLTMNDAHAHLSVYDWASTDHAPITSQKDFEAIAGGWPSNNGVLYGVFTTASGQNINRSATRNTAFSLANPAPSDIVFFVDCDMVVPPTMAAHVREIIKPGVAYFPVPYSLYKDCPAVVNGSGPPHVRGDTTANGWWRETSSGNCAFLVKDFQETVGKWDERFGDKYGREDDDMHWRAKQTMTVVRDRMDGFFHHWHPAKNEPQNPRLKHTSWHPLYEGNKNV